MYYSQLDEECVIVDFFKDRPPGNYLDIGAWDGVQMSNTRRLAELGWHGVLVEPGAKNFSLLIENMAFAANRSLLVQAAVSDTRGLSQIWHDTSPERGWAATIVKDVADNKLLLPAPSRAQCVVPTITPFDLAVYGPFHFLSVDAEGMDMRILRAIPHEMYASMTMVCAEVPNCEAEALAILAPKGFRIHYKTTCNVIFIKDV